ncbi:hypothetical protein D3C80_1540740 [compost metagenome]
MILGFSTQLNGKPTYFVEKILIGIDKHLGVYHTELFLKSFEEKFESKPPVNYDGKLHSIREDKNDRWHAGMMIDFFINCRQKAMFRFAPVLPVVSVQEVLMTYYHSDVIQISIDGRELFSYTERLEFAINDGFDNWEDFFNYFYPKIKAAPKECYTPKLIHWTDLKY